MTTKSTQAYAQCAVGQAGQYTLCTHCTVQTADYSLAH